MTFRAALTLLLCAGAAHAAPPYLSHEPQAAPPAAVPRVAKPTAEQVEAVTPGMMQQVFRGAPSLDTLVAPPAPRSAADAAKLNLEGSWERTVGTVRVALAIDRGTIKLTQEEVGKAGPQLRLVCEYVATESGGTIYGSVIAAECDDPSANEAVGKFEDQPFSAGVKVLDGALVIHRVRGGVSGDTFSPLLSGAFRPSPAKPAPAAALPFAQMTLPSAPRCFAPAPHPDPDFPLQRELDSQQTPAPTPLAFAPRLQIVRALPPWGLTLTNGAVARAGFIDSDGRVYPAGVAQAYVYPGAAAVPGVEIELNVPAPAAPSFGGRRYGLTFTTGFNFHPAFKLAAPPAGAEVAPPPRPAAVPASRGR